MAPQEVQLAQAAVKPGSRDDVANERARLDAEVATQAGSERSLAADSVDAVAQLLADPLTPLGDLRAALDALPNNVVGADHIAAAVNLRDLLASLDNAVTAEVARLRA